jgi:hypothetical protein
MTGQIGWQFIDDRIQCHDQDMCAGQCLKRARIAHIQPKAALRRASTLASLRAINFFRSDMSPLPGLHLKLSHISLAANNLSSSFRELCKTFLIGRFF